MRTTWIFSLLVLAACSANEPASSQEDCVDPSKKNPDGVCTADYQPVCGCDGVTYSNACTAGNEGVLRWTPGACK